MSRTERAPAFQCYAADDLALSGKLTREEFAHFCVLRAHAWLDVGLPTNPARLAVMLGVTRRKFAALWAVLAALFEVRDGRYVLSWQEDQRARQAERRERNAQNGQHGGRPPSPPAPNPDRTQTEPTGFPEPNPEESPSSYRLLATAKEASSSPARRALESVLRADHHVDLGELLARLPPDQRPAWTRKLYYLVRPTEAPAMRAGAVAHDPAAVGEAVREFNANGGDNWAHFEGHLRRVEHPPAPNGAGPHRGPGRESPADITRRNSRRALDDLLGPDGGISLDLSRRPA